MNVVGSGLNVSHLVEIAAINESSFRERIKDQLKGLSGPSLEQLYDQATAKSSGSRQVVAEVLSSFNDQKSFKILTRLACDSEPEVQVTAFKALSSYGDAGLKSIIAGFKRINGRSYFSNSGNEAKIAAFEAAAKFGIKAADFLIDSLSDQDSYDNKPLIQIIKQLGSEVIPYLINRLSDPNYKIREGCITSLVEIGEESLSPLLTAACSKDPDIRKNAFIALGKFPSREEAILVNSVEILRNEDLPKPEVAKSKASWAIDRIKRFFTRERADNIEETAAEHAAYLISKIASLPGSLGGSYGERNGPPTFFAQGLLISQAVPVLINKLESACLVDQQTYQVKSIASAASFALTQIGIGELGSTVRLELEKLLSHQNADLRYHAVSSLGGIFKRVSSMRLPPGKHSGFSFDFTDRSPKAREKASQKYELLRGSLNKIALLIDDPDERVQLTVIDVLSKSTEHMKLIEESLIGKAQSSCSSQIVEASIDVLVESNSDSPMLMQVVLNRLKLDQELGVVNAATKLAAKIGQGNRLVLESLMDLLVAHPNKENFWLKDNLRRAISAIDPDAELVLGRNDD